jgi:phosphoglycolate phosphatase
MNTIKQIFLDLDGPLLDGRDRHYCCYKSILEMFCFKPIGIGEYWEGKRALFNRRDLLALSGAESIYDKYLIQWLERIESPPMLALDKIQVGAIDCLIAFRHQGIRLTLVTMRKDKPALEMQLESLGLSQYLDHIFVTEHIKGGEGKANQVRGMLTSEQFNTQTLWVGDTEADWMAAKSLGCPVVLVSNGLRNSDYLNTLEGAIVMPSILQFKEYGLTL